MLPRLAIGKSGRGLDAGASVIEIDPCEVQVAAIESGFQARNFGTEPAGDVAVGVNRDPNLALRDNRVNLNRPEGVGANTHMHLAIHLQIGGRTRREGRGRRGGAGSRRGVEHLMCLGQHRGGFGTAWRRGRRGWWCRNSERGYGVSFSHDYDRSVVRGSRGRRSRGG